MHCNSGVDGNPLLGAKTTSSCHGKVPANFILSMIRTIDFLEGRTIMEKRNQNHSLPQYCSAQTYAWVLWQ